MFLDGIQYFTDHCTEISFSGKDVGGVKRGGGYHRLEKGVIPPPPNQYPSPISKRTGGEGGKELDFLSDVIHIQYCLPAFLWLLLQSAYHHPHCLL
jgi:hypothetical protein